ncbi:hypothetical protein KDK_81510 [Dictyobacter kobayashii]|uniref:Uncharacterized protein n=2 Tax=Dictyobacter kobayashii TaxID=2014872 RepID=A0A402AZ09_9CHLR|nr:hypothetical protein KDK_81510 [Dictyobacter kobayashii]
MQGAVASPLTAWGNFYVIVGTAAATLTGLMFVVLTLIAGVRSPRSSGSIAAFGTPNVVHFCAALLVAATLNAPWQALWNASLVLGLCGLGGVVYVAIIVRRARYQTSYELVIEDWVWHVIIPFASYTALMTAALLFPVNPTPTLFCIGAVTLLLVFIGIHNAWDTLTYVATELYKPEPSSQEK